jgi:hypothetical protein
MAWIRRFLVAAALSALALGVASSGAVAGGNPGRAPAPTPPDVSGNLCGDAVGFVLVHAEINQEYITFFTSKDGTTRLEINGRFIATVTGNGKTLTINASGPGEIIFAADGSALTLNGRGQVFFIGLTGGLWLYNGLVLVDPNTGTVISHTGNTTDICALLG